MPTLVVDEIVDVADAVARLDLAFGGTGGYIIVIGLGRSADKCMVVVLDKSSEELLSREIEVEVQSMLDLAMAVLTESVCGVVDCSIHLPVDADAAEPEEMVAVAQELINAAI